jgi:hypothetical protein
VLPRLWIGYRCRRAQALRGRPLLRERARKIEATETPLLDQDLADPGAGFPLCLEGSVELLASDEPELHEDVADRSADPDLGGHKRRDDGLDRPYRFGAGLSGGLLEIRPSLGEHARELEPSDAELRHDYLPEPLARLGLNLQRSCQLLFRDEVVVHQDGADAARLDCRRCFHEPPIGRHSFEV